jgi:hypothetical protein
VFVLTRSDMDGRLTSSMRCVMILVLQLVSFHFPNIHTLLHCLYVAAADVCDHTINGVVKIKIQDEGVGGEVRNVELHRNGQKEKNADAELSHLVFNWSVGIFLAFFV